MMKFTVKNGGFATVVVSEPPPESVFPEYDAVLFVDIELVEPVAELVLFVDIELVVVALGFPVVSSEGAPEFTAVVVMSVPDA